MDQEEGLTEGKSRAALFGLTVVQETGSKMAMMSTFGMVVHLLAWALYSAWWYVLSYDVLDWLFDSRTIWW